MTKTIEIDVNPIKTLHSELENFYMQYANETSICYKIETADFDHLRKVMHYLAEQGKPDTKYNLTIPALSRSDEHKLKTFRSAIQDLARCNINGALLLAVEAAGRIIDLTITSIGQKVTRSATASPATVRTVASDSQPESLAQLSVFSSAHQSGGPQNAPGLPSSQESSDPSQSSQDDTWDPSSQ